MLTNMIIQAGMGIGVSGYNGERKSSLQTEAMRSRTIVSAPTLLSKAYTRGLICTDTRINIVFGHLIPL